MLWEFYLGAGAILAGVILGSRGIGRWLTAIRTGTIKLQRPGAPVVRREDDPERFNQLKADALRSAWPGLFMFIGGLGWLALLAVAVVTRTAR